MRLSRREFLATATREDSDIVRAYDYYVLAIKQVEQDPQTVAGTLSMAQVCAKVARPKRLLVRGHLYKMPSTFFKGYATHVRGYSQRR